MILAVEQLKLMVNKLAVVFGNANKGVNFGNGKRQYR